MHTDDATRAVRELAASQYGVFNRQQAAAFQISARRLARAVANGTVRAPFPGVYVLSGHGPSWHQSAWISHLAVPGSVIGRRAAARLHGLDGFARADIELTVARGKTPQLPGVTVQRWSSLAPEDVTVVDGLPCTTLAFTLATIGSVSSDHRVELALESALRRRVPAREIEQTVTRLWRPGPTGLGAIDRVLRRRVERYGPNGAAAESALEVLVERFLRQASLPDPVRQFPVEVNGKRFRLDLAFPDIKLAVECHSRTFHFGAAKEAADTKRHLALTASGWMVEYVTWWMIEDSQSFADSIVDVYHRRRRDTGAPAA